MVVARLVDSATKQFDTYVRTECRKKLTELIRVASLDPKKVAEQAARKAATDKKERDLAMLIAKCNESSKLCRTNATKARQANRKSKAVSRVMNSLFELASRSHLSISSARSSRKSRRGSSCSVMGRLKFCRLPRHSCKPVALDREACREKSVILSSRVSC